MEANSNKNSEAFKRLGDWNGKTDILKVKFSHITKSDLKLEKDKEEQWNKSNEILLHIKWEDTIISIKNLYPVIV